VIYRLRDDDNENYVNIPLQDSGVVFKTYPSTVPPAKVSFKSLNGISRPESTAITLLKYGPQDYVILFNTSDNSFQCLISLDKQSKNDPYDYYKVLYREQTSGSISDCIERAKKDTKYAFKIEPSNFQTYTSNPPNGYTKSTSSFKLRFIHKQDDTLPNVTETNKHKCLGAYEFRKTEWDYYEPNTLIHEYVDSNGTPKSCEEDQSIDLYFWKLETFTPDNLGGTTRTPVKFYAP
jgi:hypothetical protein